MAGRWRRTKQCLNCSESLGSEKPCRRLPLQRLLDLRAPHSSCNEAGRPAAGLTLLPLAFFFLLFPYPPASCLLPVTLPAPSAANLHDPFDNTSMMSATIVIRSLSRGHGRDPLLVVARSYHEKVIDHYENPRNAGAFDKKDQEDVGTGLVGAPACGDVMKMQIKVQEGKIVDAKFKTFGCCSAIASSSYATEWVKGKTVDEASTLKNTIIANELRLPPVKLHCSMLAEDAIKAALSDYKNKKEKVAASGGTT